MKHLFLLAMCCCIIGAGASTVNTAWAQSTTTASPLQRRKASDTLHMALRIEDQQYCTKVVNAQYSYTVLRLRLKASLTNVSQEALILHRYGGDIYRVLLSRSPVTSRTKDYAYDAHYNVANLNPPRAFPELAPTAEFFILKPNESHDYEYDRTVDIDITNPAEPGRKLPPGDYLLEIVTTTWEWPAAKAEELQQRWAKYGYFWNYDVKSLPESLKLETQNSTLPLCQ
jgi:hypothetical protein